jgi:molybdopterin converting factor small subunit
MLLIMRRFSTRLWFSTTVGFALALASALAQAQQEITIWSCKDKDGRTHVTNLREDTVGKNCKVVQQSRVQVMPAVTPGAKPGAKPPTTFPREDAQTRASAKSRQREILEKELAQEEQALGQARKELAEQESVRYGDERNYARVLERLQKYKDAVELHEKNIDSLRRELVNLNR